MESEDLQEESIKKKNEYHIVQDEESDNENEDSNEKENGTDELVNESDDSINAIENWKGKGKESQGNILVKNDKKDKKVHRKTKYMSPTTEIDRILSTKKTRSTTNSLLINGNKVHLYIYQKNVS